MLSGSLRSFSRRLGAVALLIGTVAAYGGIASAHDDTDQNQGEIVGLAYEAGTGTLLKAYPQALYRSGDGGRDWAPLPLPRSTEDGRIAAVAAPADGRGVLYVAGPGLGVLRSDDGGGTWVARSEGLPSRHVVALAAHADQPDTVYAYVPEHGIYRSQDAGKSWRLMDRGPEDGIRQLIHSDMTGSMESGWIFAATPQGVQRSMDCFCLWREAGELAGQVQAVSYDPRQPEQVYAATQNGLFRSTDGGESWETVTPPGPVVTALLVTPSGVLYAATVHGGLFRSVDRASTWELVGA